MRFLENADLKFGGSKRGEDFRVALDGGRGVGTCVPGAGLELAAGFELCLWLSLTPITESCYWEPKSWVPRDPRGIFWQDSGRKHALLTSGMVTGWRVGPALSDGMVPAVHGRSRCGGCLVLFGMNRHL